MPLSETARIIIMAILGMVTLLGAILLHLQFWRAKRE